MMRTRRLPGWGWVRGGTAVVMLAVSCGGAAAAMQEQPGARLEELGRAQQSALEGGDREQILSTSRQLAAYAERLEARLATHDGRPEEAARMLASSLRLEEDTATRLLLVESEAAANRFAEARAAAEPVSAGATASEVHMALANAFHSGHDLGDTIAEIERAVALRPEESALHLALGTAFWELNEFGYNADSLREFGEAQRLAPGDFLTNYNLGSVLSEYRRFAEAEPFLRLAAQADAASPDPWLQMGANAYAEGRGDQAREALETAVRLTGADEARNNFQIRRATVMLSRLATAAGREDEAARLEVQADALKAQMQQSGAVVPLNESTSMTVNVARSGPTAGPAGGQEPGAPPRHAEMGAEQRAAVEQQMRGVIARSLNDAGTVLAREHNYAEALPLFRDAAEADPATVPALRNLGLAAWHTSNYSEAVRALEAALKLTPDDPVARHALDQARAQQQ